MPTMYEVMRALWRDVPQRSLFHQWALQGPQWRTRLHAVVRDTMAEWRIAHAPTSRLASEADRALREHLEHHNMSLVGRAMMRGYVTGRMGGAAVAPLEYTPNEHYLDLESSEERAWMGGHRIGRCDRLADPDLCADDALAEVDPTYAAIIGAARDLWQVARSRAQDGWSEAPLREGDIARWVDPASHRSVYVRRSGGYYRVTHHVPGRRLSPELIPDPGSDTMPPEVLATARSMMRSAPPQEPIPLEMTAFQGGFVADDAVKWAADGTPWRVHRLGPRPEWRFGERRLHISRGTYRWSVELHVPMLGERGMDFNLAASLPAESEPEALAVASYLMHHAESWSSQPVPREAEPAPPRAHRPPARPRRKGSSTHSAPSAS